MQISISFFCSVASLCALGIWRLEQLLLVERSGTIVGDHEADAYAFQLGQESKTMTRVAVVVGAVLAVVGAVYGWRTGIYEHVFPPAPPVVAASLSIDCDQVQFPLTVQPNTRHVRAGSGKREGVIPVHRQGENDCRPVAQGPPREPSWLSVQAHEHRKSPDDQRVDVDSNHVSVAACKGEGS